MFNRLKRSWHDLRQHPPGVRFESRYRRRQRAGGSKLRRVLSVTGGGVLAAAGLFLMPAPGPGTLVLIVGAALLAEGSLPVARALDRLELVVRRVLQWGLWQWHRAPLVAKGLLVLVGLGVAGGLGFGAYHLLFRA